MSMFNEKKTSRFLSLKDDDDEDDENMLRESILLSQSCGQGMQK